MSADPDYSSFAYDPTDEDCGDDPSYFDEDERDEDGNWPDDPVPARPSEAEEIKRRRDAQDEEMMLESALFPWLDDPPYEGD